MIACHVSTTERAEHLKNVGSVTAPRSLLALFVRHLHLVSSSKEMSSIEIDPYSALKL